MCFISPPHGVYFGSPIQTDQTANGAGILNFEDTQRSTLNFERTPRTQALLRRGFFFVLFSRFRFFSGDKSPASKTKTRIRPLFRHAQHIKIDVLGDLNAQYTCLRCRDAHEITLWTRLRGLDRVSYPHRGACDNSRMRNCV